MKKNNATFSFRIPEELLSQLHKFADDQGSTAAVEIRRAVKEALRDRLRRVDPNGVR